MTTSDNPRKKVDWAACEKDFRTGTYSNRQLAEMHGTTEGGIRWRAKHYGWQKDLTAQVKTATHAKLLRSDLRTTNAEDDAKIVEEASDIRVEVVRRHRRSIAQLDELKGTLAEKAKNLLKEIKDTKTLADGASTVESLTRTISRLIPLERQAFGLDGADKPDELADIVQLIEGARARGKIPHAG